MQYPLNRIFLSSLLILSVTNLTLAHGQNPVTTVPSPIKQIRLGVPLFYIACSDGLQLMTKQGVNFPACVKMSSIHYLIDRGWSTTGYTAKIVGTLNYEERKQGGHFLFCNLYSITTNETESLTSSNQEKLLVYTNTIINPDDSSEQMFPGNKLTHDLTGKRLQITGLIVDNHGTLWCPNWRTDGNGTFKNIIPDNASIIVPSKIDIIN